MSYLPLIFVVIAALIHATWNLMAKRAAMVGPSFVFAYNLVCFVVYAPWVAWILLRQEVEWTAPIAVCILLSGVVHLAYSLCLQRGYQVAPLSVVYPVARGSGPMLSSIGAFLILRETPTALGALGLFAIVAGIGMIATKGDLSTFRRKDSLTGVYWGAITGLLIASYSVIDAYGVKVLRIDPVVLDWCGNSLRFVMLAPIALRDPQRLRERMRGYWSLAIGVGVLAPLSYILVLTALEMNAPLSLVAPMREMSMMIGALFGMILLREPVGIWRLGGCAALIAGVIMLGSA